jgi:hypothetical protein
MHGFCWFDWSWELATWLPLEPIEEGPLGSVDLTYTCERTIEERIEVLLQRKRRLF